MSARNGVYPRYVPRPHARNSLSAATPYEVSLDSGDRKIRISFGLDSLQMNTRATLVHGLGLQEFLLTHARRWDGCHGGASGHHSERVDVNAGPARLSPSALILEVAKGPEFGTLVTASERMADTFIVNGNASHALPGGPEDLLALVDERLPPDPYRFSQTSRLKKTTSQVRLWLCE
jgi:hypothetical protein